jgi:signal transduction histidine kinase
MAFINWQSLRKLPKLVETTPTDPEEEASRLRFMERNVGLPVKAIVIGILLYFLFFSHWADNTATTQDSTQEVVMEVLQRFFFFYVIINLAAGIMLLGMAQLPLGFIRWVAFTTALIDGLSLAGLTLLTGGFDSMLFWVFLGLIVRNAVSVPEAPLQILLNLLTSGFYILAGFLDVAIYEFDRPLNAETEVGTEPFLLRVALLIMMTMCCYAFQVLVDKYQRTEDEAREFALRREQLRVTGQLAAEIAHQLKNPLGIINNAAFNLQRNVKEGKATITQQIRIIREEVERSDRIITDLMGYARLADGRLERLSASEELDRAIEQVYPAAAHFEVTVHRDYGRALPNLLMQRNHLSEILINLLQNAREAMNGVGNVTVSAHSGEGFTVVIKVADDGPGISPELRDKIFEPYYTTKTKGTGLGLAIVKHNVEIYGGIVKVESELGKGTSFVVTLPARSLINLRK